MHGIIASRDFEGMEKRYGAPSFHIRQGDLHQALLQAARVQLDFLLVDIDFSTHILEELHQYRVQRPDTRIILIAMGRQPGDPLVAKLVSIGIYDIISEPEETLINELHRSIKTPASYTQAARWLQLGQPSGKHQPNKNVPESIKEILVQQRPLGMTTIAIAGAGPGTGVSHLCLAIAAYLARINNRVVLTEWPLGDQVEAESQYAYLSCMGAKYESKKVYGIDVNTAHINGVDIFLSGRSFRSIEYIFPVIAQNLYDYLVLDLGELNPEKVAEMDRAALSILVVNASPYRIERFLPVVDERDISIYTPNLARWKIALNLAKDEEIKWFLNNFPRYIENIYPIPYMAQVFEQHECIHEILQPVLPVTVTSNKKPFSILRRVFLKAERRGRYENWY